MSSNPEDLTPQARIRAAAVDLFGRQGFDKTTIRQIATRAGVSPGLVIHHYGSKNALHEACDDWVAEVLITEKSLLVAGPLPRMDDYVAQHPEYEGVVTYLVTSLREGGAMAHRVFERLMDVTREMFELADQHGLMRMPADREAAYACMVALSCGVMLLGEEVARALGGTSLTDAAVVTRYGAAMTDMFVDGLFTPAYADALRASVTPKEET